jgi:hypothetical protein
MKRPVAGLFISPKYRMPVQVRHDRYGAWVALAAGHGRPAIRNLRQDVLGRETGEAGFCLWGRGVSPRGRGSRGRGRWRPLAWERKMNLEAVWFRERGGASPLEKSRYVFSKLY